MSAKSTLLKMNTTVALISSVLAYNQLTSDETSFPLGTALLTGGLSAASFTIISATFGCIFALNFMAMEYKNDEDYEDEEDKGLLISGMCGCAVAILGTSAMHQENIERAKYFFPPPAITITQEELRPTH